MKSYRKIFDVKFIALTAMFAALITLTTAFIKIGDGTGYTHPGDSMVYLAATILPSPSGIIASAIGGFFADLLAGYPQWALITAIIKVFNAFPFVVCRLFLHKLGKDNRILNLPTLLMLVPSAVVTVCGYSIANIIMMGQEYAITALFGLFVQSLLGSVLFIALGMALDRIGFKQRLLPR